MVFPAISTELMSTDIFQYYLIPLSAHTAFSLADLSLHFVKLISVMYKSLMLLRKEQSLPQIFPPTTSTVSQQRPISTQLRLLTNFINFLHNPTRKLSHLILRILQTIRPLHMHQFTHVIPIITSVLDLFVYTLFHIHLASPIFILVFLQWVLI